MEEEHICIKCNTKIVGRYYLDEEEKEYCYYCYKQTNSCMKCGKLSNAYVTINTYRICTTCHENTLYKCDICEMPVGTAEKRDEARYICNYCFENGLQDEDTLEYIYKRMKDFLSGVYGMAIEKEVSLEIVDKISASRWYARSVVGEAENYDGSYCIKLIKYSSLKNIQYFMVHELTHIWQYENDFIQENKKLLEGFACWMEGKYAEILDEPQWIEYLRKNDNPVHGDGYRFIASLEKKNDPLKVPAIVLQLSASLKERL